MQDKERRRARNRNLEKYGVEVLTPDGVTPEQASSQNSHSYDEQQQYSDGYFEAQHRYSSGNGMQPGAYGEYDVQNLTSYNTNAHTHTHRGCIYVALHEPHACGSCSATYIQPLCVCVCALVLYDVKFWTSYSP